jgi:CBS domain-containing protein
VRTVRSDETVRDVLSELLLSPLAVGAVLDAEGRVQGVLDVELIHELLERESPKGAPA